jgi:hypothetical protein
MADREFAHELRLVRVPGLSETVFDHFFRWISGEAFHKFKKIWELIVYQMFQTKALDLSFRAAFLPVHKTTTALITSPMRLS